MWVEGDRVPRSPSLDEEIGEGRDLGGHQTQMREQGMDLGREQFEALDNGNQGARANLIAKRGSTKCRTRSKRRSLANDMVDAIFTYLAEGLNTLFAMFDG
jgi:hypothetical protein